MHTGVVGSAVAEARGVPEHILRLLLAINTLGLSIALVGAFLQLGVWSAYACTGLASALYLLHLRRAGRAVRTQLLLFGLTAGVVALAADWWLVSMDGTLTYGDWGPSVLCSPLYMPFSWAGITMTVGFTGWVIARGHGHAPAALAGVVMAGLLVPAYEILAGAAGWWSYAEPHQVGCVPSCIALAAALLGLPLPALTGSVLGRLDARVSVACGVIAGLAIAAAYITSTFLFAWVV